MPQVSRWTFMFFIMLNIMVLVIFVQAGISPATLPWLSLLVLAYVAGSIFAFFGHIIIPRLMRIYIGDAWIENDVLVVCNRDAQRPEDFCTASMIFKLLPLQPVADMQDDQVKALITSVGGSIFSMPVGTLYCIHKTEDPIIPSEIKRLEAQLKKAQAQSNMPRKSIFSVIQSIQQTELERERARLMKSRAIAAISFIMIQAKGRNPVEAVSRVRIQSQHIESIAQQIGCTAKKISGVDLRNLVEALVADRALRWVEPI